MTPADTIDDDKSLTTTSVARDISKVAYFVKCHQKTLFRPHHFLDMPASSLLSSAANRKNQKYLNTTVRLLEACEALAKGR